MPSSYWYVSLSRRRPTHGCIEVTLINDFTVIEMSHPAWPADIDRFRLVYMGHGGFDEQVVQMNMKRMTQRKMGL